MASKKTSSKATPRSGTKRRRTVVRVKEESWTDELRGLLERTHLLWGAGVCAGFVLLVSILANWTTEQPLIAVDQISRETRAVRVAFAYTDEQTTERLRTEARQRTIRQFEADTGTLDEIRTSLEQLPRTVAGVGELAEIAPGIRQRFGLTQERLEALQAATAAPPLPKPVPQETAGTEAAPDPDSAREENSATDQATAEQGSGVETEADEAPGTAAANEPEPIADPRPQRNPNLEAWDRAVSNLDNTLRRVRPLLNSSDFVTATQEGLNGQILLNVAGEKVEVPRNSAISLDKNDNLADEIDRLVEIARFPAGTAEIVRERLVRNQDNPTFRFNQTETVNTQQRAADAIREVVVSIPKGQLIFTRGDKLTTAQLDLHRREMAEFKQQAGFTSLWSRRLGVTAGVLGLSLVLAGHIAAFCPSIARRSARILWLAIVIFVALLVTALGAINTPEFMTLSLLTPTVLVATLLAVAYSPRAALVFGAVHAGLAMLILGLSFPTYILTMIGVATAVSQLGDLSRRRAIVRMSIVVSAVLLVSSLGIGLIDRPLTVATIAESNLTQAVQAALSGLLAGMITLFVLPFIERVFDIATGMTLVELRDPKQPLLREMQQRAPGTYNHSMNVAAIAETAAASIGADALLTYVGCLYHDIGKINKPDYFVENQARGHNKHDKLSPAMSLLVIVGHVKDGLEMAREHNLPKSLHHFIEGHHGTTLVEYFYKRAKQKAEGEADEDGTMPDPEQLPSEVDYRYPGPRPRTKEVAIVMLADAVESATRTLPEPTPSRIDALVRDFANRRLMDGQFDDCDLTLRELHTISESISKTVASIYHGRISYGDVGKKQAGTAEPKPTKKPDDVPGDSDEPKEKSA